MPNPPKVAVSVGSALLEEDMIMAVILGGVDIFRLQSAKFTLDEMAAYAKKVRAISVARGKPVEIMFDYSGAQTHLGEVTHSFTPKLGDNIRIVRAEKGTGKDELPLPVSSSDWNLIKEGERIFLADGAVQLRVYTKKAAEMNVTVEIAAEEVKSNMEVNFPDSDIHVEPLGPRERAEFPKIVALGLADWATLSFVESAAIVNEGKRLLGSGIKLMAKIESPKGVENAAAICAAAEGIVVARGDLAIQAPMERLGIYERLLVKAGKAAGKHVMMATQFLESMVTNAIPLRAELSDVATAAVLGVDSILLTNEVAKGAYPLRALAVAKGTLAYTSEHLSEVM
jgi:pyruvate kinase